MGRSAPFDAHRQETIYSHQNLQNETWNAFESHFIHNLLQGGSIDEAGVELLKQLHDLWPWPNLLFLKTPARKAHCFGLPPHLCSQQTAEWLDEAWPRIRRVYQQPDWQFNENAHCLSGVWNTFIERIANPLLDTAWVEPVNDATGEMCGILVLFMPHRAWFDQARIHHQRRAACLAGYLTSSRQTTTHEAFVHTLAKADHALRSPLNAIIGYGELLAEELHQQGQNTPAEDTWHIVHAARKLQDLLDEVLHLSRLLSGTLILQPAPLLPSEILQQIESEARAAIEEKGNKLVIRTEGEDTSITQDKYQLHRLLAQLLANANQWTENGTIRVSAKWNQKILTLSVEDEGPQLTSLQCKALKDGLPVPPKENEQGRRLGMGLMLVKHLAEQLHGRLIYKETPNGKEFEIQLPNLEKQPISER